MWSADIRPCPDTVSTSVATAVSRWHSFESRKAPRDDAPTVTSERGRFSAGRLEVGALVGDCQPRIESMKATTGTLLPGMKMKPTNRGSRALRSARSTAKDAARSFRDGQTDMSEEREEGWRGVAAPERGCP
jgi:hypothetical protein